MLSEQIKAHVRERAANRCEYCQLHADDSPLARLQIDHIVPQKHGGETDLQNLALACVDCNLHKGSNLTGIDPETGQIVELFSPRRHQWDEHFEWDELYIVGRTAIGRTTVRVLCMNSDEQLDWRSS